MLSKSDSKVEPFKNFKDGTLPLYRFVRDGVNSKASLAVEILLNGTPVEGEEDRFIEWNLPNYIKEGLTWLRK